MSSRKLSDCSIPMQAALAEFELQLHGAGIPFVRACTYRTVDEQDELYARGRTKPGFIATWARGGQSPHNDTTAGRPCHNPPQDGDIPASNAADYYPLLHGKLCDCKADDELALWAKMGQIGIACGLDWGGAWTARKIDRPHFQLSKEKKK